MWDEGELDRRIDAVLSCYADSIARDDLDAHVLAGVKARIDRALAKEKVCWLMVSGGLALAASLLAVVAFGFLSPHKTLNGRSLSPPSATSSEVGHIISPIRAPNARLGTGRSRSRLRTADKLPGTETAEALPKLNVFPTPRALSKEEEALALFARQAPASEVRELLMTQVVTDQPIAIPELEIPPIQPLDVGER